MNFRMGIRAQLGLGIALTTIAGIGFIGLMSIKIVENRAVYWKTAEAKKVVSLIKASASRLSPREQGGDTIRFMGGVLKEIGITDFRLTGPAGNILLKGGSLPERAGRPVSFAEGIRVVRLGSGWLRGPGDFLYVRAALEGPLKGRLDFTVSLSGINADLKGVRRFLLLYAAVDSVIIIAFGFYFLSASIINPLRNLTEAAARVAGGAFGERADIKTDNEIGVMASSFNKMADRVEEEIKTLERVNKELVTAQEELLRSSTMAAVGRLAAGLAHEIGNPLGAVGGYLTILERGTLKKEEEQEIIKRTARELSRIDSIIKEFLEFARPDKTPAGPVDVNRVIKEAVSAVEGNTFYKYIAVDMNLAEGLPMVSINDGKLRQVFLNILINAAHSMEGVMGDKRITIETDVETALLPQRRFNRRKGDRPLLAETPPAVYMEYVVVRIADRGSGISGEDAKKIFDPFFTTKEVGKGTGLGLFVSQSIINNYGGEIDFQSEVGQGSTFIIKLPSGRS